MMRVDRAWEEQHYQEIKKRRDESAAKKQAQEAEATKALNDFEEKRKVSNFRTHRNTLLVLGKRAFSFLAR